VPERLDDRDAQRSPADPAGPGFWAHQGAVTDPGAQGPALDLLPADVATLLEVSRQLVFHYRAGGGFAEHGIAPGRLAEVDTRYADAMLERLVELGGPPTRRPAGRPRPAAQRLVGCCRDFTVLFVAMARRRGIAARARVGFAAYFEPGWLMDHVIAEVWEPAGSRWRMVEPEIGHGHVVGLDGSVLDVADVPARLFLTGGQAWQQARAGHLDADSFVVAPDLPVPDTRGWPYLRHNLVHDLAALNKQEMLLWDDWGVLNDPLAPGGLPDPGTLALLDGLAELLVEPDPAPAELRRWGAREGFAVPSRVTSYSPLHEQPIQVDVERVTTRR
jgi:hypothetical protein